MNVHALVQEADDRDVCADLAVLDHVCAAGVLAVARPDVVRRPPERRVLGEEGQRALDPPDVGLSLLNAPPLHRVVPDLGEIGPRPR